MKKMKKKQIDLEVTLKAILEVPEDYDQNDIQKLISEKLRCEVFSSNLSCDMKTSEVKKVTHLDTGISISFGKENDE